MLKADSAHYWSSDSSMHHKYCVQVCEATSTQTCCLSKYTLRNSAESIWKRGIIKNIYLVRILLSLSQYVNQGK